MDMVEVNLLGSRYKVKSTPELIGVVRLLRRFRNPDRFKAELVASAVPDLGCVTYLADHLPPSFLEKVKITMGKTAYDAPISDYGFSDAHFLYSAIVEGIVILYYTPTINGVKYLTLEGRGTVDGNNNQWWA